MTTTTAEGVDMEAKRGVKLLSLGEPAHTSHDERIITRSIDAGGTQAVSQLRILHHVMEKIKLPLKE
jgi:hypothetical protein